MAGAARAQAGGEEVAPAPGGAEEVAPALWSAPAECGTEAEFVDQVAARSEQSFDRALLGGVAVEIDEDETGWFGARVRVRDRTRSIRGGNCGEVSAAAALIVATAIGIAKPEASTAVEAPARAPRPPRRARPSLPWHAGVGGFAAGDLGTVPSGGLAAGGAIWTGLGRWRGEVAAAIWLPRDAYLEPGVDAGAEIGLRTLALRLCRQLGWVTACVGGEAGRMRATGFGYEGARERTRSWWAATAGGRLPYRLTPWFALVAEIEGTVAVSPPQFTLDDGTEVFEPAPVGLRAHLALDIQFF